jgi:hypothetical protein
MCGVRVFQEACGASRTLKPERDFQGSGILRAVVWLLLLVFAVCCPRQAAANVVSADPTPPAPSNFCINGAYPGTRGVDNSNPSSPIYGSFCVGGDAYTGSWHSKFFRAGVFSFLVAGYPNAKNVGLQLENGRTGERIPLRLAMDPGESFMDLTFESPRAWQFSPVRILAEDRSVEPRGWLAVSEPVATNSWAQKSSKHLIFPVALAAALFVGILLPGAAACFLACWLKIEDLVDLCATFLLGISFSGYIAFWLYFFHRSVGTIFSYISLLGSLCFVLYAIFWRRSKVRPALALLRPVGLVVTGTILVLCIGFQNFSSGYPPRRYAAVRFSPPQLAGDNYLPELLADEIYRGHISKPMHADWLSSDRPPLQAGNTLWMYGWLWRSAFRNPERRGLAYIFSAALLQCLFLIGLWALLTAFRVPKGALALATLVCFISGFTWINCFYTWPKLYPVAYLLLIAAYVLAPPNRAHSPRRTGILVGACMASAMLGHGGSVFAILGCLAALLLLRISVSKSLIISALITAAVLYAPWMAYQKYVDPPGDRLVKWHIAGEEAPHPERKFTSLLLENYRSKGWLGAARLKEGNFFMLVRGSTSILRDAVIVASPFQTPDARSSAAAEIRWIAFVSFFPCINVSALGPIVLAIASFFKCRSPQYVAALRLWVFTLLTLAIWCVLMFGPDYAIVHQGTYLTVVLALAASSLAFWAIHSWLAITVGAIQMLWAFYIYVWSFPPPNLSWAIAPIVEYPAALNVGIALSLGAFLWFATESLTAIPKEKLVFEP